MRLVEIAQYLGTPIVFDGSKDLESIEISEVKGLTQAKEGSLSFLGSPAFMQFLETTAASALITREHYPTFKGPQLIHKDPHFAHAKAAWLFYKPDHGPKGISPQAVVDPSAELGQDVTIHPFVTVGPRARIGDRVVLYPGVSIGADVEIGEDSVLRPHAVVYEGCIIGKRCLLHAAAVVGADGFGFAVSAGEICKIPQVGIVRIGDDVELGVACTIDRATHGETRIGSHCKFDNHVQIGHNVEIGSSCMFSAQVGIAGSTKVGQWVLMGGQSGIADHMHVADKVRIGAKTAVVTPLTEPGTYVGFPAVPQQEWGRQVAHLKRLRDYERRLRALEKKLAALDSSSSSTSSFSPTSPSD